MAQTNDFLGFAKDFNQEVPPDIGSSRSGNLQGFGKIPREGLLQAASFTEPSIRKFETGATRDLEDGKYDYEGFLSPSVLYRYAEYMHKHRFQKDGTVRDSDNWQKGIPLKVYMKSGWRHFFEWWACRRNNIGPGATEEALCALLFNVMGYLHEYLKVQRHDP